MNECEQQKQHQDDGDYLLRTFDFEAIKADFQSELCTLKSLLAFFVLFHVRHHKM